MLANAAAPDLLEALEFVARRFDTAHEAEAGHVQFSVGGVAEHHIRAVIEKATKGQ